MKGLGWGWGGREAALSASGLMHVLGNVARSSSARLFICAGHMRRSAQFGAGTTSTTHSWAYKLSISWHTLSYLSL